MPAFLKGAYSTKLIEKTSNRKDDTLIDSGFEDIPLLIKETIEIKLKSMVFLCVINQDLLNEFVMPKLLLLLI